MGQGERRLEISPIASFALRQTKASLEPLANESALAAIIPRL
jgi:hypothetical protein